VENFSTRLRKGEGRKKEEVEGASERKN